jgi:DNA-binding transcriptional regulator YiaG
MQVAPPNRLRDLRETTGITIKQIADACHVYDSTVSRWQDALIPQQHLPTVARLLGVTVPQLAGWEALPHKATAA